MTGEEQRPVRAPDGLLRPAESESKRAFAVRAYETVVGRRATVEEIAEIEDELAIVDQGRTKL